MKVLFLSVEVAPLAKAGGLADVAGSLPKALHALGHDVRVAMPAYSFIDRTAAGLEPVRERLEVPFAGGTQEAQLLQGTIGNSTPLYLIAQPAYFDRENIYGYDDDAQRFLFFCRAALQAAQTLGW
ncbi:MAG: glycogen/starch synthase, partial [Chloroflexi bacterium]|nr:glycogen/starch synthase [Chloroflexota bacterium]